MKRSELLALAEHLQVSADDPIWADHCEISKRAAIKLAAILRQIAEAQPVSWQLIRSRDGFVRGSYDSEPTTLQLEFAALENEEYRSLYVLPLED